MTSMAMRMKNMWMAPPGCEDQAFAGLQVSAVQQADETRQRSLGQDGAVGHGRLPGGVVDSHSPA